MKLTLTLPDELYEHYQQQAQKQTPQAIEKELIARLTRFKDVPNQERAVVLWGDDRRAIEGIFQTTIDTPAELIRKIKQLCTVKIGPIDKQLTASDLSILHTQATFHGIPVDDFLLTVITRVLDESLGRI